MKTIRHLTLALLAAGFYAVLGIVLGSSASAASTYTTSTQTGQAIISATDLIPGSSQADDQTAAITFPFPVTFYGVSYTSARVSTNGNVQFTRNTAYYYSGGVPDGNLGAAALVYQGDLITYGGGIFKATYGTTPNRTFVLEWRGGYYSRGGTQNEEIIFYENSPTITMIYGANADNGTGESSGVQASGSGPATQFSFNQGILTAGLRVDYAERHNYRVTTNADDGNGTVDTGHAGTAADPFIATTLRAAIDATNADPNSDIVFDPTAFATAQTITLSGTDLIITSNMSITGSAAGVTVDGNGQSRVFTINGSGLTVSMSGLTVTGGNGVGSVNSGEGGGILLNSGNLTLLGCSVTNNTATDGGGIFNDYGNSSGAKLIVTNCTVSGNTATNYAGGVGSGVGTMQLNGSTIANNTAAAAAGVYNDGTLTITNCTISGNHGDQGPVNNAGGIYTDGPTTITNSTITGNTASGSRSAGGLRCGDETTTVSNTIIAGNTGTSGANADVNNASGGTFTSGDYNLIGDGTGTTTFVNGTSGDQVGTTGGEIDAKLGPLQDNGGRTDVHARAADRQPRH